MEPMSDDALESAPKPPNSAPNDDYLANQIADARLALESTLDDLTLDLARAADVRRWVRRYPWAALGTALVTGFTIGHCVTKSRRRHDATAPTDDQGDSEREFNNTNADAKSTRETASPQAPAGGWRSAMISALFDILRLAITQFVSASVRQAAGNVVHRQAAPQRAESDAAQNAYSAAQDAASDHPDPNA